MARYAMVVDTRRCIGCHTCSMACKQANNLPQGVWWNRVVLKGALVPDALAESWPNGRFDYITVSCQHCSNPACAAACPTGATAADPETGVVRQDYEACIGCQACIEACPYEGVRTFNATEPAGYFDHQTGDADAPAHRVNVVEKCTFCGQRLERGEEPACMRLCPERARFWGDLDDPESYVSQLLATREYERLLPELGTEPNTYYLI